MASPDSTPRASRHDDGLIGTEAAARPVLVVVGNGMVGHKLLSTLAANGGHEIRDIVTFCEETRPAYDRVGLSSYSTGSTADELSFADGRFFTPDERARFIVADPGPPAEKTSARYPFVLLTGRGSSSQWHTQTRTSKSPVLRELYPQTAYVELNPADAAALEIEPHDWVNVKSARGSMRARAFVTETVQAGQVFVPMHYAETNRLTFPSFDPYSRQPSYKHCAVDVSKVPAWEV